MKKLILTVALCAFISGCATNPYTGENQVAKTAWGTGIGAAAGAGVGALIGGKKGALIGAGAGALVGGGTGAYMDVQARKLRQELVGTGVQVVEQDGKVYLVMPGNITFGTNEYKDLSGNKSMNSQDLLLFITLLMVTSLPLIFALGISIKDIFVKPNQPSSSTNLSLNASLNVNKLSAL